jgi:hypothetical protein
MDARYEGPNLSRFLSEDPNFIQDSGPENWQNTESAEPQYAELNGFVRSSNSVYLASPQNLNPYTYVDDNPLKYTDPTGKDYTDYNAAFTVPVYGVPVGLTGGIFVISNGYLPYIGVITSVRPDLSWSVTNSKNNASPGFSVAASEFLPVGNSFVGPGGQAGYAQDQNGDYEPFGEYGVGKPGLPSASIYYAFTATSLARLINSWGGSFQYISTPQTIGINSNGQSVGSSAFNRFSPQGSGGASVSLTGAQAQALQGVASSFGSSSLTGAQVQAALAVKAAFAKHSS